MSLHNNELMSSVREYYGQVLASTADLQTSACCSTESLPLAAREAMKEIHPEVMDRFYGCGAPLPPLLDGLTVLDLGCGSGRDCYLLSKLVGPNGRVIGVDMTEEQLEVARRHQSWHADKFGFSNVEFREGYIEDLASADIAPDSIDLVVSNCVVNLSPDKPRVFGEIWRALKPGGELFFADVFADRRIPKHLMRDPVLLGECLAGALYGEDFRRHLAALGWFDPRVLSRRTLSLYQPDIVAKIGMVGFESRTIRAFKLALEDRCEDFGQTATYLGTLPEHPHFFDLDDHHHLETGRALTVCGNTAAMLADTRYGKHFRINGDHSRHFGLFGGNQASTPGTAAPAACC